MLSHGAVYSFIHFCLLQSYMNANPQTIVIDPIENLKKLLLRHRQYHLIATSDACLHGTTVYYTCVYVCVRSKHCGWISIFHNIVVLPYLHDCILIL